MSRTLATVNHHQPVQIEDIVAPESLRQRLIENGFLPGTHLSLHAKTPFGGPLSFFVRGSKVAIRKAEADMIFVH